MSTRLESKQRRLVGQAPSDPYSMRQSLEEEFKPGRKGLADRQPFSPLRKDGKPRTAVARSSLRNIASTASGPGVYDGDALSNNSKANDLTVVHHSLRRTAESVEAEVPNPRVAAALQLLHSEIDDHHVDYFPDYTVQRFLPPEYPEADAEDVFATDEADADDEAGHTQRAETRSIGPQQEHAADLPRLTPQKGETTGPKSYLGSGKSPQQNRNQEVGNQPVPQVVKVRPGSLVFPNSHTNANENKGIGETEGDKETETAQRSRPQKRKVESERVSEQASPRKRLKSTATLNAQDQQDSSAERDNESNGIDPGCLVGQWPALRKVFQAPSRIGLNYVNGQPFAYSEVTLVDGDVKRLEKYCKHARKKLAHLEAQSESPGQAEDPPTEFQQIRVGIEGLCGENPDFPTDFKSEIKGRNIRSHLVPSLVKLLKITIACYQTLDRTEMQGVSISIDHLRVVNSLVEMILSLERALGKYPKPDTTLALSKPLRNDIFPPLREISRVFANHLSAHDQAQRRSEAQAQHAAERAIELRHEEIESARQDKIYEIRRKWASLHEERWFVEGGIMPASKQRHLRIPEFVPECDQKGSPYERLEVFQPRLGPPSTLVEKARQKEWAAEELYALHDGLRDFSGRLVFEKIFRRHCIRKGLLNAYNVTEIVTVAAWLKEQLSQIQSEEGEVKEWVKNIPDWTKRYAIGKENVDYVA